MVKKLKVNAAQLVAEARSRIEEIEAVDAIAMLNDPDVVFVDIRDVRERERSGSIAGSFHCPRGMTEFWVDPESPYHKDIFERDAKFVFHCASGWRSALTVAALKDMGFENASHIKGGMTSWEKAGGPIEKADRKKA